MLVGAEERVMEQLIQTELLDLIGEENIFSAQPEFLAAKEWIAQGED